MIAGGVPYAIVAVLKARASRQTYTWRIFISQLRTKRSK